MASGRARGSRQNRDRRHESSGGQASDTQSIQASHEQARQGINDEERNTAHAGVHQSNGSESISNVFRRLVNRPPTENSARVVPLPNGGRDPQVIKRNLEIANQLSVEAEQAYRDTLGAQATSEWPQRVSAAKKRQLKSDRLVKLLERDLAIQAIREEQPAYTEPYAQRESEFNWRKDAALETVAAYFTDQKAHEAETQIFGEQFRVPNEQADGPARDKIMKRSRGLKDDVIDLVARQNQLAAEAVDVRHRIREYDERIHNYIANRRTSVTTDPLEAEKQRAIAKKEQLSQLQRTGREQLLNKKWAASDRREKAERYAHDAARIRLAISKFSNEQLPPIRDTGPTRADPVVPRNPSSMEPLPELLRTLKQNPDPANAVGILQERGYYNPARVQTHTRALSEHTNAEKRAVQELRHMSDALEVGRQRNNIRPGSLIEQLMMGNVQRARRAALNARKDMFNEQERVRTQDHDAASVLLATLDGVSANQLNLIDTAPKSHLDEYFTNSRNWYHPDGRPTIQRDPFMIYPRMMNGLIPMNINGQLR